MRPADSWKDYELLDATGGNRLERWGETILIRPDPQVVWKTEKQSPLWAKADAIYHRSNQGGGEWEYRRRLPEKWKISCGEGEDKLTLIVSPTGFKHTGVFPEQAVNWAWYARKIRAAGRPVKVLNLFGYTGGATLACAAAGATVCHVDASKGIVAWGKDNAVASGLADRPIRWLVDDCAKFVAREKRRGNTYDGIIMDPPSYGRGHLGQVVAAAHGLAHRAQLLEVHGVLLSFSELPALVLQGLAPIFSSNMAPCHSLAMETSVDLTSATTSEPTTSFSSSTERVVMTEVTMPQGVSTSTSETTSPRMISRTLPLNWLRTLMA